MKSIRLSFIYLVGVLVIISCNPDTQQHSSTSFIDFDFFSSYSIKIPNYLNQRNSTTWTTPESSKKFTVIQVNVAPGSDNSLVSILNDYINSLDSESNRGMILEKQESFNSNGYEGLMKYFKKDINKCVIPVYVHFLFSVIRVDQEIIEFNTLTMNEKYLDDLKTSLKSIKPLPTAELTKNEQGAPAEQTITMEEAKRLGYQVFPKAGFIVKCDCKLKENTVFLEQLKLQGSKYPVYAYVCAMDESSSKDGVIININIYNMEQDYIGKSSTIQKELDKKFLESYISDLKRSSITYKRIQYRTLPAVEYSLLQMDILPTKALVFVVNKRSYLIQVGTKTNLSQIYTGITDSFQIIN